MQRKSFCLLIIMLFITEFLSTTVNAAGFDDYPDQFEKLQKSVVLVIDTPNAAVNMKKTQIDESNPSVMPLILNDRTLVPVRFVAESFNSQVTWDAASQSVNIRYLDKKIRMVLNSNIITVNDVDSQMDVAPQIVEDRTMVPLRAIVENLGKQVFWDPKGLIVISDAENILDSEKDSAFIDTLIDEMKSDREITAPVFGGIFDQKKVSEVVDYDKVEQPYNLRDGIPNVHQKLLNNEPVKIAYLGGSITELNGYRNMTDSWFKSTYPKSQFESLNAGVGGTSSSFGVLRLGTDVLSFNPDLLFVEFAVNDFDTNNDLAIIQSMEGIIRQCWTFNPNMDIVFVYTIREADIETASEGKYSHTAKIHDYIAEHYGIPSVYMGYEVAKEAANKELIFNGSNPGDASGPVFSNDGVHPNSYGSEMYFDVLREAFKAFLSDKAPKGAVAHELKEELYSKNLGAVKTYDPSEAVLSKGFKQMESDGSLIQGIWGWRAPSAYSATQVGESVTVHFNGTQAGLMYLPGPDAPCIDIIVDGNMLKDMSLFDAYHGVTGYYVSSYMTPVLPKGEHTVIFKINDTKADKAQSIKNSNYNVSSSLAFLQANPDWFNATNFIVGKVLVNGDLIK